METDMEDKPKVRVVELVLEKFEGEWSPEKKPVQTIVVQYDPDKDEILNASN